MKIVEKGDEIKYDYSSVQVNLDPLIDDWWVDEIQFDIPKQNIYREYPELGYQDWTIDGFEYEFESDDPRERYGLEKEPHITILYGLKQEVDISLVKEIIGGFKPFYVNLTKTSCFRNEDAPNDVLKVDVESEDLYQIHSILKELFDNAFDFPVYSPHMTLAYIKKGTCSEMEGLPINKRYLVTEVEWTTPIGDVYILPLKNGLEESMEKKERFFGGFKEGDFVYNTRTFDTGIVVRKIDKLHYRVQVIDSNDRVAYDTWSALTMQLEAQPLYGF